MSANAEREPIGAAMPRRIPMPLPGVAMAILAAAYCLLGLAGHAPWKTEDAIGIGIVHQMLGHADFAHWLVPHLAGEVYLDDGPLFYVVAAICAKLFSFALPIHDGARLGAALSLATSIWFCREAARKFFGPGEGDSAALLLMGCLGLFAHAHMVDGENGALAGAAIAWYGLAQTSRGAFRRATPWLALGFAIMLLTKGPLPALPVLGAALAAPLIGDTWRRREYALCLLVAVGSAALLFALWLLALHGVGVNLPEAWWNTQMANFDAPSLIRLREQSQLLSWAVWPLWPVGLWALWDRRRRLRADGCLVPAIGALIAMAMFVVMQDVNEIFAMPILLPTAVLAGAGFTQLRRGAANALIWFGAMTFGLLGALVWLGWFAMMTGVPAQIAANFAKLEPGHAAHFSAAAFALALALSLAWVAMVAWSERSPLKGAPIWGAGVTLVWGLVMLLLVDWIDYGKSYAPMAAAMKAAIEMAQGDRPGCIASRNLGQAQRAAFDYHGDIVTRRVENHADQRCRLLLVQGVASRPDRLDAGWEKLWEGSRPRERERFRLYVRR